jgi:hypothetical protein
MENLERITHHRLLAKRSGFGRPAPEGERENVLDQADIVRHEWLPTASDPKVASTFPHDARATVTSSIALALPVGSR